MDKVKLMNNIGKLHELLIKVLTEYAFAGLDNEIYMSYIAICDDSLVFLDFEVLVDVYKDLDSVKGTFLNVMNLDTITNSLRQIRMLILDINSSNDDEERILERDYPRSRNYDYDLER